MKIAKKTASEIVFKSSINLRIWFFIFLWSTGFIGSLLFLLLNSLSEVGVTTLTCQRVEPKHIDCEKVLDNIFGLKTTTNYQKVIRAEHKTKRKTDENCPLIDNWVAFATKTGNYRVIDEDAYINCVRGDAEEMASISNRIQSFIDSNQPELIIQRNPSGHQLATIVIESSFIIIGVGVIYFLSPNNILIFDKKSNRLIRQRQTLLGKKSSEQPLNEILGIEIKTTDDGCGLYTLKLLPTSISGKELMTSNNLTEVQAIHDVIKDFLKL